MRFNKLFYIVAFLSVICGTRIVNADDNILAVGSNPDRWDIIITDISVQYDNSGSYVSIWSGEATLDIASVTGGNLVGSIGGSINLENHGSVITAVKITYYEPYLFKGSLEYSGTTYYTPDATDDDPGHITPASTTPPAGLYSRIGDTELTEMEWTNLNIPVSQNMALTLQIKPKYELYNTGWPTAYISTSPWRSETDPFEENNYNFKLIDTYWPNWSSD